MKKIWILGILLVIILPIAFYLISPLWNVVEVQDESPLAKVQDKVEVMTDEEQEMKEANKKIIVMEEPMPPTPQLVAEGMFKPEAHDVEGKALIIQDGDSRILRFENFDTVNGPNLHIFLASTLDQEDTIDLGEIKATKGNVNYDIPEGIDIEKYNKVLVWCVPFKVLFSYAELA